MCARRLIDDETFQRERTALQERRKRFELNPVPNDNGASAQQGRLAEITAKIDLVEGAPRTIGERDPVQLRSLLQQLQLEMVLRGRRLDITAPEPLSQLVKASSISNWCPREESNLYLRNRNPTFYPLNYRGKAVTV